MPHKKIDAVAETLKHQAVALPPLAALLCGNTMSGLVHPTHVWIWGRMNLFIISLCGYLRMCSSRPRPAVHEDAVYSESRRMLLSWRIAYVNHPSSTFRSFFIGQAQDFCERSDELSGVFVGQAKDHLDLVVL